MDDEDFDDEDFEADYFSMRLDDLPVYHPFACGCDECWYGWNETEENDE